MVNISFSLDSHFQNEDSKLEASKLETEAYCHIWWHYMALKKTKQQGIHTIFSTHYYQSSLETQAIHGMWHIHGHVIAKDGHKIDFPLGAAMKWHVVKWLKSVKHQWGVGIEKQLLKNDDTLCYICAGFCENWRRLHIPLSFGGIISVASVDIRILLDWNHS